LIKKQPKGPGVPRIKTEEFNRAVELMKRSSVPFSEWGLSLDALTSACAIIDDSIRKPEAKIE